MFNEQIKTVVDRAFVQLLCCFIIGYCCCFSLLIHHCLPMSDGSKTSKALNDHKYVYRLHTPEQIILTQTGHRYTAAILIHTWFGSTHLWPGFCIHDLDNELSWVELPSWINRIALNRTGMEWEWYWKQTKNALTQHHSSASKHNNSQLSSSPYLAATGLVANWINQLFHPCVWIHGECERRVVLPSGYRYYCAHCQEQAMSWRQPRGNRNMKKARN